MVRAVRQEENGDGEQNIIRHRDDVEDTEIGRTT